MIESKMRLISVGTFGMYFSRSGLSTSGCRVVRGESKLQRFQGQRTVGEWAEKAKGNSECVAIGGRGEAAGS
jgi:hypothetical protein